MKAECSIEKFKTAITQVERITGKNLTLPILSSILIEAQGKSIKLRATNLNLGIEVEIPSKVEREGVCALPGSVLLNLFSTLSDEGNAEFDLVNGNLSLITKKNKFLLKSQPHEDFPSIPTVEGSTIVLPVKKIIEGIKSVYFSASPTDIKPEISSVYIYSENNSMVFVSTDSFRLAEKRIKMKDIYDFPPLLIPYKNIIEIIRIFGDSDDDVVFTMNKNQIGMKNKAVYLTSRIIDGIFPDYKQIIPKDFNTEGKVLKQDLIQALKLSSVFKDKFNQITLVTDPKAKKITIYAKNSDIGENTTELEAALTGERIEINLNYRYLVDCFQSIPEDSVTLLIKEVNKPLIIKGVSDTTFTYLVMPMNR